LVRGRPWAPWPSTDPPDIARPWLCRDRHAFCEPTDRSAGDDLGWSRRSPPRCS